jgi:hypothetical protein
MKAKKKAARGGKTAARGEDGWKATVRQRILGIMAFCRRMGRAWDSAARLFDSRNAEKTFADAMQDADMRLALSVFALSSLITFIMAIATLASSAYVTSIQVETLQQATGIAQAAGSQGFMASVALASALLAFIICLPLGLPVLLGSEYAAFAVLRAIKGKATFAQQLYLSSLVALATSFAFGLGIFMPVPCLQTIVLLCFIVPAIYLATFACGKAYSAAHRISFAPAFVVALVLALARLAIFIFLMNALAAIVGLPAQATVPQEALGAGA